MTDRLRIIFAGTPEFAATHLKDLLKTEHEICAIFTQPDRPAGRGKQLKKSEVKLLAEEYGLPVYQPQTLKTAEEQQRIRDLKPNLMIVVAYGMLLPQAVLDIPTFGCWNVHASLLPRWRGAAPIQRAIFSGDKETGVTIMQMDAGLDTGDILLTAKCEILPNDTSNDLHSRLASLGADTLIAALEKRATLTPMKQNNEKTTYAKKIHKEEAVINWDDTAFNILCKTRAFNPWPIAETSCHGQRIRIWRASVIDAPAEYSPGKIISVGRAGVLVATQKSCLQLEIIQLPGKKPLSVLDLMNGNKLNLSAGDQLGS